MYDFHLWRMGTPWHRQLCNQSEIVVIFQSSVSRDAKAADNVMSVSSTLGNSLGKVSLLVRMEEEEERFFLHRLLLLSISPGLQEANWLSREGLVTFFQPNFF